MVLFPGFSSGLYGNNVGLHYDLFLLLKDAPGMISTWVDTLMM
jgi:hypothetical protein